MSTIFPSVQLRPMPVILTLSLFSLLCHQSQFHLLWLWLWLRTYSAAAIIAYFIRFSVSHTQNNHSQLLPDKIQRCLTNILMLHALQKWSIIQFLCFSLSSMWLNLLLLLLLLLDYQFKIYLLLRLYAISNSYRLFLCVFFLFPFF